MSSKLVLLTKHKLTSFWYNIATVKNWNTDISGFKNKKMEAIWELSQLINYGFDNKRLSEKDVKLYWKELKPRLDPERARMLKYLIWGKLSLLPNKKNYWGLFPKINS